MDTVPETQLTTLQRELRHEIQLFVAEEIKPLDFNEWEWKDDPTGRIPWDVIETAEEELGLRSLAVPEEFMGYGASLQSLAIGAEELAAGDMGIAILFERTWWASRVIDQLAPEPLREEFFEQFVDDPSHFLAVITTMTPAEFGADGASISEGGIRIQRGGDELSLTGTKRFVPNGGDAQTFVVEAVDADDGTVTPVLVPRETPGLEVSAVHEPMGQRLVNHATVDFDGAALSTANELTGADGPTGSRRGVFSEGDIGSGAIAIGTARVAFEEAFEYAHQRVQGGTEIINHEAVAYRFADMAIRLHAARYLLWAAANERDNGDADYWGLPSMARVFATDAASDVSRGSLETFGGAGIMLDTPQQKYFRDTLSSLQSDAPRTAQKDQIVAALRNRGP